MARLRRHTNRAMPLIERSRCQMFGYIRQFDNGAVSLGVSSAAYPELFARVFPEVVAAATEGWKPNKKGNLQQIYVPPGKITPAEVRRIERWIERFKQYVAIGKSDSIEQHFHDELDFCLALDFGFTSGNVDSERTLIGESEYQLKYQNDDEQIPFLSQAICIAISDLGISAGGFFKPIVTHIPAAPDCRCVARDLAKVVAEKLRVKFAESDLTCPKPGLKGKSVDDKIPTWKELYEDGCVEFPMDVEGKTVIVVDDLYQSGATMWMFAQFLKERGASVVIGLPCVKSMRDTDNQ